MSLNCFPSIKLCSIKGEIRCFRITIVHLNSLFLINFQNTYCDVYIIFVLLIIISICKSIKSFFYLSLGKQSNQFDDIGIPFKNGSLIINSASEEDEGYYLCEANNGIGAGLSAVISLKVNGEYC